METLVALMLIGGAMIVAGLIGYSLADARNRRDRDAMRAALDRGNRLVDTAEDALRRMRNAL